MELREARVEDAAEIARIHLDGWREAYAGLLPPEVLAAVGYDEQELRWVGILGRQDPREVAVVAVDAFDRLVGFAAGGPERTGDPEFRGELYAVAVLPAYRRRGLGRRLVAAVGAGLLAQGIGSLLARVPDRDPARALCRSLGGRPLGRSDPGARPGIEVTFAWDDLRLLVSRYGDPGAGAPPGGRQ